MLSLRLLTAAIGIPLLVLAVWLGSYWLLVPVAIITVVGTWEFHRLLSPIISTPPILFSVAIALGLTLSAQFEDAYLLIAFGIALLTSLAWKTVQKARHKAMSSQLLGLAGPFYIGVPLSLSILLRDQTDGRDWLLVVIIATFAIDTGAYAVGKLIGKHMMAPRISPNKTWEGVIGGMLGGVGITFGLTILVDLPMDAWKALPLGLLLAVAAISGDLAESWLKRIAGVKDSGMLIPGHGGVLDRIDSIVATFVVAYFWFLWAV
jgi:phosphatidate cytidylyltransferase